jgi:amidohydrolase
MDGLRQAVLAFKDELTALRRDFHMHPELGFQEFRTAGVVEEYLQGIGLETGRAAGTGVVAVLEGQDSDGPVLLLRADMDALPITEEHSCSYKSRNPGVMHACGHDAHMAMLLVTAKLLSGMRSRIKGKIKFVFQPNEEIAGAEKMIEEGVLENPKVDAAMGIHIWTPLPSGTFGIKVGAVTSSMEVFTITIHGQGGHTGYPESAVDPILAAAAVVQGIQQAQTRRISAMKPTVIMFGKIQGGSKSNIIPDEVVLEGTIRYLYSVSPEDPDHPLRLFTDIVTSISNAHGCSSTVDSYHENDAVVNDISMAGIAGQAAAEIAGKNRVTEHATMACEDFAAFAAQVPSVFTFLGTASETAGSTYPHHNPRFAIDEETLPSGVEFLLRSALHYFSAEAGTGT